MLCCLLPFPSTNLLTFLVHHHSCLIIITQQPSLVHFATLLLRQLQRVRKTTGREQTETVQAKCRFWWYYMILLFRSSRTGNLRVDNDANIREYVIGKVWGCFLFRVVSKVTSTQFCSACPQLESKLEQKLFERLRSLVTWNRFSGIGICLVSFSNSIWREVNKWDTERSGNSELEIGRANMTKHAWLQQERAINSISPGCKKDVLKPIRRDLMFNYSGRINVTHRVEIWN